MGTMVAMNRAHVRGQKHHLLAVHTSKFPVCGLPSFGLVLLFLAIVILFRAGMGPPVGIFVVKHEVLPSILE